MPKAGWQSLTIGDVVYDYWYDFHQARKHNFQKIGITSLSGLISLILDTVSKLNGPKLTEIIQMEADPIG